MPNNQDTLKLLPLPAWGYCARLEQGTGVDNWFLHWPLKRGSSHTYYSALFCSQEQAEQLAAAINTPTPREQELEAQNKALWELVSRCEQAFNSITNITTDKVNAEFMLRKLRETDDIVCATLAAIQKAREAK